jgi:hypothetical protein
VLASISPPPPLLLLTSVLLVDRWSACSARQFKVGESVCVCVSWQGVPEIAHAHPPFRHQFGVPSTLNTFRHLPKPGYIAHSGSTCVCIWVVVGVLSVSKTFWEGCRLVYNRGLSNTFQAAHTFTLSREGDKENNYTFAPVYVGTRDDGKVSPCVYRCHSGDVDGFKWLYRSECFRHCKMESLC